MLNTYEKYLWRSSIFSKVVGCWPATLLKLNSFTGIFQVLFTIPYPLVRVWSGVWNTLFVFFLSGFSLAWCAIGILSILRFSSHYVYCLSQIFFCSFWQNFAFIRKTWKPLLSDVLRNSNLHLQLMLLAKYCDGVHFSRNLPLLGLRSASMSALPPSKRNINIIDLFTPPYEFCRTPFHGNSCKWLAFFLLSSFIIKTQNTCVCLVRKTYPHELF